MPESFPKQARLTQAKEFEAVYRAGERINAFPLRARALRRNADSEAAVQSRLGLAIGRKVGPSVLRNRWKRAVREAFRIHRHRLPAPYDIVVTVARESSEADVGRTEQAFLAMVKALTLRQG